MSDTDREGARVDLAAELRARAEKARAEANHSAASDGLLYAGLMVEARTYDEAASLVEALRSPDSEVRVGGWEVRSEGMHGEPPHAIERGTGPDLEVFVTGIESYDDACKIEAALNEHAPPDPAPDRVAEGARIDLAREAIRETLKALLVVKGELDKPYPTDPRWSPWSRWIDRHEGTPWKLLQRADAALHEPASTGVREDDEAR